jgi:cytochrome b561
MNDFRPIAASAAHTRHPLTVIALHWLTAILILAAAAMVLIRDEVEGRGLRLWLINQHRSIGLLILALVALRVVARVVNRARMARHDLPRALALVSSAGHLGLYALLLATPLLGLALTWAHGQDVSLLGLVQIPHLLPADPDLADTLTTWHPFVAWSLLAVAAAHAAAAVWHHRFRRDGVLSAMLPGPVGIRV